VLKPFSAYAFVCLAGAHALIALVSARALMRGDDLVKPTRIAGSS